MSCQGSKSPMRILRAPLFSKWEYHSLRSFPRISGKINSLWKRGNSFFQNFVKQNLRPMVRSSRGTTKKMLINSLFKGGKHETASSRRQILKLRSKKTSGSSLCFMQKLKATHSIFLFGNGLLTSLKNSAFLKLRVVDELNVDLTLRMRLPIDPRKSSI